MLDTLVKKFVGSRNDREIKKIQPLVAKINDLEPRLSSLTDEQLKAKTAEFKQRSENGESLEDLLPDAFAVVRETGKRALNMRHFDVQLIGGVVLHQGRISEMKTGEGKTLVATLPAYLNALEGKGVHVITVNDYLARRDSEWMGRLYKFLGLTVGVIQHGLDDDERRESYGSDITYGTNNEFGFDYLRDNMKFDLAHCVQRPHQYAIVDEVDSILIDEARTPLIISGPSEESTDKYYRLDKIIPKLRRDIDYQVDEKHRTVTLTEEGFGRCENLLGVDDLSDIANMEILHHINQALRAHTLYKRDVEYVVKEGEVIIVDEFTGRLMPGRRWSDGLHQAVEAKEGLRIQQENQTLATITFQNYFRMYKKLAGMTGTAETEAEEFLKIYKLDVAVIPTNRLLGRIEYPDVIYRTEREKFEAVVKEIKQCHERGQPALVGTISIDRSEKLSSMLKRAGVKHVVLNAKYHEKEAEIVAQAGRKGAVTIATNMAGRGTDILLGGNAEFMARDVLRKREIDPLSATPQQWNEAIAQVKPQIDKEHEEVVQVGGLHIIGTERHEARRIDNQLRGRSGRQGDPGSSRFYVSLEDDLMRIFAADRISGIMQRLGMEEGVPIESRFVSKQIENAQKRVEGQNFSYRKHVLEYDDVMNKQREAVYGLRKQLLEGEDQKEYLMGIADDIIIDLVARHASEKTHPDEWDFNGLQTAILQQFGFDFRAEGLDPSHMSSKEIEEALIAKAHEKYDQKETLIGSPPMRYHERMLMLQIVDSHWKDHLLAMDHLKEGIGLRGYGQRDPLVEYKKESYTLFEDLMGRIEEDTLRFLFLLQPVEEKKQAEQIERKRRRAEFVLSQQNNGGDGASRQVKRDTPKIGRNDPCPCGSGKKFKKCHGVTV
ncbi:MAG: preprotein translocase subunit SecA [Acidobacteria bacterium 13_1_20CM_2_55_15]|nr:MAG: preprotein translocase subunit SecA [Acidobacteria bacterium 13_1_40CM_3_56_11]OLE89320.1 MAG: preprotein translocase subunit SecA [Acidobacteria bacterium 13_1_20CM_2_55_15]